MILSFGEVLWDVVEGREYIGGAPFNVAAHAVRCGMPAALYTRIGTDTRGDRARNEVERLQVDTTWVQIDRQRPTGWVDVTLRDGEPTYTIGANAAWDAIAAPSATGIETLRRAGIRALVCGTLAQRSATSRAALQALRAALPDVPVFYDVNLRPPHTPIETVQATLPGVRILKVNAAEASALAASLWHASLDAKTLHARLREKFGITILVLTRGEEGATVISEAGELNAAAVPVKLASAVGAGDAFAAAFLSGWLRNAPLDRALAGAIRLGAFVASRPEAIPDYPPELQLG